VAEVVERTGMQDQISVMSLRYEMVRKMKSLRPNWTVGLLTATAVGKLAGMEGDFLAVSTGMATPARVRAAHAAGKKLFVWTVDDPMTMALMVTRGADGLITNEPAVARRLLRRMDEATTGERLLLGLATWFGIEPRATDTARDAI
jgi:glycerophosphoryl diester phosphodiesterase